jgi:colicin import membrane protein
MSQTIESSVVVSLDEIMRAEQDRIHAEAVARQEQRAAEQAARARAESERRDAELRRIEEEQERQRRNQCREREELARLEAIRVAELEKVRREADRIAQQEALRQAQHFDSNAIVERLYRQLRVVSAAFAATIVIAIAGSVAAVMVTSGRADARFAFLVARNGAAQNDWERERSALALNADSADQRYAAELKRALDAEMALDALKKEKAHVPPKTPNVTSRPPQNEGPIKCQRVCPRGDPLCTECKPGGN